MHDDACIGGRSENNIKCVVHDDLGWKNRTTRYILPRHWLYEWFSLFQRCATYSVLSQFVYWFLWYYVTWHVQCTKKIVGQSYKLCFMRITLISMMFVLTFVCLYKLAELRWTTTGAVNSSVSGAQMLNRLISPHIISREACLPSQRSLHDFHTSLSLLRFAIYNINKLLCSCTT